MSTQILLRSSSALSRFTMLSTAGRLGTATRAFSVSSLVSAPKKGEKKATKKVTKKATKKVQVKKKPEQKKPAAPKVTREDYPPKRPLTPYLRFFTENYSIKSAFNDAKDMTERKKALGALSTEAGNAWKGLSEKEKKKYSDAYFADKIVYEKNMKEYMARTSPEVIKEINKRQKKLGNHLIKYTSNEEKRPLNPFIKFFMEQRGKEVVTNNAEFLREVGVKWRGMSDAAKAPYREAYNQEHEEYKQKVAKA